MTEQKKSDPAGKKTITAVIGQPVQVNLQSMAGSTGYGWYLTHLDGGLALSSVAIVPTAPGIAPVSHQFSFIAITAGTYTLSFSLLAPWRPNEEADNETYTVTITAPKKSAKEDIEAGMAGREFLRATSATVGQAVSDVSTVLKYAAPMVQSVQPQSLIYAAPMVQVQSVQPQSLIYAAPMTRIGGQFGNAAATMIAYAAPIGPSTVAATGYDPCLYAQQYSICQPYAAPWPNPQLLYAAPMTQSGQCQCPPQPMYAAPMIMRYAAPYNPGCQC
jgi:Chagasin family peptidase inhibitor I42